MFETNVPAWQERFGWFWFNYKEIYRFTDEQLEEKVKSYADMGITTLIGFTSTHFRFSFMPYKDKIHACIKKIVELCHKYGVRYIEHHSSALFFCPENDEEWEEFINDVTQKGDKMEDWVGLMEAAATDQMYEGYHLSEMVQINGSTGLPTRTPYASHVMCHNNLKYREVYFKYLEEIYALGVDGIMTDEVQWFGYDNLGRDNCCTCPDCRALFKEWYGYDLPEPKDWDTFYGDYTNPAFVAWKQFKVKSNEKFVRDVNRHYESLGLQLLRPNYVSGILHGNLTGIPFEECADIWDFVFQENGTYTIISTAFAAFAAEAIHRYAMSADRGRPSMSLFYPYNKSNLYFSWSLAKSWGQLYNQTSEDQLGTDNLEAPYRAFEQAHAAFMDAPRRYADFAFLCSPMTRDFTADRSYTNRFCAALQGSYLSGFGTDMVFETASLTRLCAFSHIVCAHTAMLSDETMKNLAAYVKQGGTLAIIGDFAKYDGTGALRDAVDVHAFFDNWDALCSEGKIVLFPASSCSERVQRPVTTNRYLRGSARAESASYVVDEIRETTGKTLLSVIGRKKVECNAAEDILASAFDTDAGIAVHLVNITDVLAKNGETVAHYDPVKPFCEDAVRCGDVAVSLDTTRTICKATAYTPEKTEGIALTLSESDGRLSFTVPAGFFAGYCMIELA